MSNYDFLSLLRDTEKLDKVLALYDTWCSRPDRRDGPLNATRAMAHTIMRLADTRLATQPITPRAGEIEETTRNGVIVLALLKGYPQSELYAFLDDLIEAEEKWRKKHGYAPIHSFERVGLTELIREREWN